MTNSPDQSPTGEDGRTELSHAAQSSAAQSSAAQSSAAQSSTAQPHAGRGSTPTDIPVSDASTLGIMRIGDTERNSALDALAEHLTAGRVTLDEFGERTAKVMVARIAGELVELFDDLPAPHPTMPALLGGAVQHAATSVSPAATKYPARLASRPGSDTVSADRRTRAQIIVAAAASASVFVALALFFLTGTWLWFLLIPAISGIAKAVWGTDWDEPHHGRPGSRELDGPSAKN